jgi:hypothetical protein
VAGVVRTRRSGRHSRSRKAIGQSESEASLDSRYEVETPPLRTYPQTASRPGVASGDSPPVNGNGSGCAYNVSSSIEPITEMGHRPHKPHRPPSMLSAAEMKPWFNAIVISSTSSVSSIT